MKIKNAYDQLKLVLLVAAKYLMQHAASMAAMQLLYRKPWPGDTVAGGHTSIVLEITPQGRLYKVQLKYYLWNEVQKEESWMASYGWHSNGHLMEIGGSRYCIFNSSERMLYLESFDDNACEKKVEVFTAI